MPKFIPYDHNQSAMIVINYKDQLQPGTFEHVVFYLVHHKLDLSIYYPRIKNDKTGRPAYDPAILLSIILFAYSKGITSSREIEWCCKTNIIFKALSCDTVPHFTTIAHFVSSTPDEIEKLFEQILLICHEQGLLGNELFAIDGCKMSSDGTIITADTGFANEANMKYLKEKGINAYIPDNQFRSRDPKFKNQKTKYGKRHQNDKNKPAKHFTAEEFEFDPETKTCICPAGESMWLKTDKVNELGHHKLHFERRVSKCRQCKIKMNCMRNPESPDAPKGHGRQVSFIIDKAKRKSNYTDWMKERVDSPEGKLIYSHRMSVVEPVFGNIGTNKGLNRFSLRDNRKVQGQWRLYCMIHNIEKIKNYGKLAA